MPADKEKAVGIQEGKVEKLLRKIRNLPETETRLRLSYNDLGKFSGDDLARALAAIPQSVTTLGLSGDDLGALSGADLARVLAAIPQSVTALDLSGNGLGKLRGADLARALAAIPQSVTALDLSGNGLGKLRGADLARALAVIPQSVTALDLSENGLGEFSGADLARALAAIPKSVTALDLRYNDLREFSGADLAKALAAIPKSVTALDLRYNDLGELSGADLARALAAIPKSVTTLDLSENGLGALSGADLAAALAAIPQSVTTLDLRYNDLGEFSGVDLARALAAIPQSVTTLDLSGNVFWKFSGADLAKALDPLLKRKVKIKFSADKLVITDEASLTALLNKLPFLIDSVPTILLAKDSKGDALLKHARRIIKEKEIVLHQRIPFEVRTSLLDVVKNTDLQELLYTPIENKLKPFLNSKNHKLIEQLLGDQKNNIQIQVQEFNSEEKIRTEDTSLRSLIAEKLEYILSWETLSKDDGRLEALRLYAPICQELKKLLSAENQNGNNLQAGDVHEEMQGLQEGFEAESAHLEPSEEEIRKTLIQFAQVLCEVSIQGSRILLRRSNDSIKHLNRNESADKGSKLNPIDDDGGVEEKIGGLDYDGAKNEPIDHITSFLDLNPAYRIELVVCEAQSKLTSGPSIFNGSNSSKAILLAVESTAREVVPHQ